MTFLSLVCLKTRHFKAGYYDWEICLKSAREIRKDRIVKEIKDIHTESHENYRAPKITHILRIQGEVISERTIGKYMRENDIKAQYINPSRLNEAWCTDITYI